MSERFATTQWSQVLMARDGVGTEARDALTSLCEAYWYPLYAFVRRQGHDADSARDLTQGFFAYLMEKEVLREVDPSAGRFRSFLLATLKHFLAHADERRSAKKRGGHVRIVSLDAKAAEERYRYEPSDELTPEQVFERRWALTLLERALSRLEEEFAARGAERQFEKLQDYLTGERPSARYREVAGELEMSENALRGAVLRMRRRFGDLLRGEIAQTVAGPEEVDDEVRHLLNVIGPWGPSRP